MKIAVCVKHVPDGRVRLDPGTKRIDRSGDGALNRVDSNALEEALRLKDSSQADVVLVSLGPPGATESLLTGLALGADRAVLVSDPLAEGSDLVATSRLLAAALERESPDLVLFGQQSSDGAGGLLWGAVAERLRRPLVSQAAELAVGDGSVRVTRQSESGDDVSDAPLPALVGVSDSINEPRYASLRGRMGAKKKPMDVLALGDLGVSPEEAGEAGSRTVVLGIVPPAARGSTVRLEDAEAAPAAIVEFLVGRDLL
jgi:electron transfer flavoprotein beta subunit